MRVNFDDQFLVTAGKDGCLILFDIKDKEARGNKLRDGFLGSPDEILITRGDLEDIKT
jgi:cilia- and flagella-associated protein 57